jgi:hypothetical protein
VERRINFDPDTQAQLDAEIAPFLQVFNYEIRKKLRATGLPALETFGGRIRADVMDRSGFTLITPDEPAKPAEPPKADNGMPPPADR